MLTTIRLSLVGAMFAVILGILLDASGFVLASVFVCGLAIFLSEPSGARSYNDLILDRVLFYIVVILFSLVILVVSILNLGVHKLPMVGRVWIWVLCSLNILIGARSIVLCAKAIDKTSLPDYELMKCIDDEDIQDRFYHH